MLAECKDDLIYIKADYIDKDRMVMVPGTRWDKTTKVWHVPLSWAACITLRGVFGSDLELGPNLQEWAWREKQQRIDPALALREAVELDESPIAAIIDKIEAGCEYQLKPYQRVDVTFQVITGQSLLGNEPGLGKTAVTIRTLQVLREMGKDPFPVLVVCPNSIKHPVWVKEFAQWASELTATVVEGGAGTRRKILKADYDVYIINWEALRLHSRLAPYGTISLTEKEKTPKELNGGRFRTVVLDEAHRLRDPKSQQSRAAWQVTHEAEFRFALTGTPINNHAGDLWGLEHAILPAWFPGKSRYLDRWTETSYNFFGGLEIVGLRQDTVAEFRQITDPTWRRIPKEVVLPQLPEKLPVAYRYTYMTPAQARLYKEMQEELIATLEEGDYIAAPTALAQLTRLIQFASASAEVDIAGNVLLKAPSAKVDDLVDLLEELDEEPLVVAAVSRQLIELAAAKLTDLKISHGLVTGAQTPVERGVAVDAFQAGKLRVLLMTIGAGAEGLTLTRANRLLFMQESFSPLENEQACNRIHRIGSEHHKFVQIIVQISPDTVEERKMDILRGKKIRIEEVLRDQDMLKKLLGGKE